jgi:HSP20 family protein
MYYPSWLRRDADWSELNQIQREMNRLFDQFSDHSLRTYPLVNIYSNNDGARITAELPGYDSRNVQVSITGDELSLKGNRADLEMKENECCHRQERQTGSFERHIRLPFTVNMNKVDAKFKNGILTITLTRAEADKPKKIQIKTN